MGHYDWFNLRYNFRSSPQFADGATLPSSVVDLAPPEMTMEDALAIIKQVESTSPSKFRLTSTIITTLYFLIDSIAFLDDTFFGMSVL